MGKEKEYYVVSISFCRLMTNFINNLVKVYDTCGQRVCELGKINAMWQSSCEFSIKNHEKDRIMN